MLKVNAWVKYHPGGEKSLQHMIGKDATDEINACVPLSVFCPSISFLHSNRLITQVTFKRDTSKNVPISDRMH